MCGLRIALPISIRSSFRAFESYLMRSIGIVCPMGWRVAVILSKLFDIRPVPFSRGRRGGRAHPACLERGAVRGGAQLHAVCKPNCWFLCREWVPQLPSRLHCLEELCAVAIAFHEYPFRSPLKDEVALGVCSSAARALFRARRENFVQRSAVRF